MPKIFLFKEYKTKRIVTQTSWVEHIPIIFPKADFIYLLKKRKTFLKTAEERGCIHYDTFINQLGRFLENNNGYKIIHPKNAGKAAKVFNTIPLDIHEEKLGESVLWDKVYNTKS